MKHLGSMFSFVKYRGRLTYLLVRRLTARVSYSSIASHTGLRFDYFKQLVPPARSGICKIRPRVIRTPFMPISNPVLKTITIKSQEDQFELPSAQSSAPSGPLSRLKTRLIHSAAMQRAGSLGAIMVVRKGEGPKGVIFMIWEPIFCSKK